MTTKAWLINELEKHIAEAQTGPWSMRLHMLRRSVSLVLACPEEPAGPLRPVESSSQPSGGAGLGVSS